MAHEMTDEVRQLKRQIRVEALARRAQQTDAERVSRRIFQQIAVLPEYVRADTLMLYLDIGNEVRTQWFVPEAWADGKRVVVPYCQGGDLGLFRLDSFDELAPGMMDILEPKCEWRCCAERKIAPADLRPDRGPRCGIRPAGRPAGIRQGLLRQTAPAGSWRCSQGGRMFRVPAF